MAITFGDWNVSLEHQVKELFFPHSNLQPSIVGLSLPRFWVLLEKVRAYFWFNTFIMSGPSTAHSAVLLVYYITFIGDFWLILSLTPPQNVSSIRAETSACFLVSWASRRAWHTGWTWEILEWMNCSPEKFLHWEVAQACSPVNCWAMQSGE